MKRRSGEGLFNPLLLGAKREGWLSSFNHNIRGFKSRARSKDHRTKEIEFFLMVCSEWRALLCA